MGVFVLVLFMNLCLLVGLVMVVVVTVEGGELCYLVVCSLSYFMGFFTSATLFQMKKGEIREKKTPGEKKCVKLEFQLIHD